MKISGTVSVLLVLSLVLTVARHSNAVDCGEVVSALSACSSYLQSGLGPSSKCCPGVQKLQRLTGNTADRRSACQCVKNAKLSIRPENASKLPGICGVSVNIPTSSTNCRTIP